jgi:hypothetical protein
MKTTARTDNVSMASDLSGKSLNRSGHLVNLAETDDAWKLGLGVVWHDRSDHKDPNRFTVVEFAGHVMMSFGDQHGGKRRMRILLQMFTILPTLLGLVCLR